jgi:hypothetical protein
MNLLRLALSAFVIPALSLGAACSSSSGGPSGPGSGGLTGGSSGGAGSGSGGSSGGGSGGGSGSSGSGSSSGGTEADAAPPNDANTTVGDMTWSNGQMLTSNITIPAGTTVTVAPGAKVDVGAGVTITVAGTLTAAAASDHASLTGASWIGIVVSSGGSLQLDGVDISGASAALAVQGGGVAEYDDGTIHQSAASFDVAKGGTLGMKHSTLAGAAGTCNVAGSFTADYLTYTAGGSGLFDGIVTTDTGAKLSIEDSIFTGPGSNGPLHDMLVAQNGAAQFHVAYTNIKSMHCGFHFDDLSELDVSYVNDDSNAYGFMLYGSGGAGPFTVTYSNLYSNGSDYDTLGSNSPFTFDHDYTADHTNPGTFVTTTNPQSAMVSGTGPR